MLLLSFPPYFHLCAERDTSSPVLKRRLLPQQKNNNLHLGLAASLQSFIWASFVCAGSSLWWERTLYQSNLQLLCWAPGRGPTCTRQVGTQENVCEWPLYQLSRNNSGKHYTNTCASDAIGELLVFVAKSYGYTTLAISRAQFFKCWCYLGSNEIWSNSSNDVYMCVV